MDGVVCGREDLDQVESEKGGDRRVCRDLGEHPKMPSQIQIIFELR